jgi:alpha,alpha-trehalase
MGFPNAWAPYQWLGYQSMKNYGFDDLAEKIKNTGVQCKEL